MAFIKLQFKPGVNRDQTDYSNEGGVSTWIWFLAIPNPLVSGSPGPFTATTIVTWA